MKNELKAFLDEVQDIYSEIWNYGNHNKHFKLACDKSETITSIKIRIHSADLDYLSGTEIERCLEIANKYQETCFYTWLIDTTKTIIETKKGESIYVVTPQLVIHFYQSKKEENQ